MFGMSFSEIMIIAVIAVIALGPEKLPKTMVEIAKYFKMFKKSINDAKANIEQEIKITELKEEAKKFQTSLGETTTNIRKKLTFEELDDIKKGLNETVSKANTGLNDLKNEIENNSNSTKTEEK